MVGEIRSCPHCGTSVMPTHAGKCPACHANMTVASYTPAVETSSAQTDASAGMTQMSASQWAQQVLTLLHGVEEPYLARRSETLKACQEGLTQSLDLANEIEHTLLPHYGAVLQHILEATVADHTSSEVVKDLQRFAAVREHSWQLLAKMIRTGEDSNRVEHTQSWEQSELLAIRMCEEDHSQGPSAAVREFQTTLATVAPKLLVTPVIIGINITVFVLMVLSGVHILSPTVWDALKWGANFGPRTLNGQEWRLVSSMFVHFGIIHLGFNMWVLRDLAQLVERVVGNVGFLLLYFISGIAGSLASLAWNPSVISAGASGAVFGVAGALVGLIVTRRDTIPPPILLPLRNSMLFFLGVNVLFGMSVEGIDMAAHIGGLVAGFVSGVILSQPLTAESIARRKLRNSFLAIVGASGLTAVTFLLPEPPADVFTELSRFDETTLRLTEQYNELINELVNGSLSNEEFADRVERDILPDWTAQRERIASLAKSKQVRQDKINQLLNYIDLRAESWRLRIEGMRENNQATIERANELWLEADAWARQSKSNAD